MLKTENISQSKVESKKVETIIAERYSKTHRLHHWVHVACMIMFLFTGFELYIKTYFIGNYVLNRTLHFVLGIFVGGWDLIFYLAILIKDKKLLEIFPTPREILDLVIIFLCSIKVLPDEKYPHYDFYILEEKKYIMKYHPAQKLLALTNLIMIFLMGVTGIALAEELSAGSTGFLAILAIFAIPIGGIGEFIGALLNLPFFGSIRYVHFLMFIYFLASTMIHFYFALIPQNRQRLRGMVTGNEEIPIQ